MGHYEGLSQTATRIFMMARGSHGTLVEPQELEDAQSLVDRGLAVMSEPFNGVRILQARPKHEWPKHE